MKFTATAEHTGGKSVGHPCSKGVHSDPTDSWQAHVEAATVDLAQDQAYRLLAADVAEAETCDCRRQLRAGSEAWWDSVVTCLWPEDQEAADALDAADLTAWRDDPYGIVPASLKAAAEVDA